MNIWKAIAVTLCRKAVHSLTSYIVCGERLTQSLIHSILIGACNISDLEETETSIVWSRKNAAKLSPLCTVPAQPLLFCL